MTLREAAQHLIALAHARLHPPRDPTPGIAQTKGVVQRLGTPVQEGAETRIPMAMDGHFWVDAKLNGRDVRFLIDSGATMTTISRSTAARAGVAVSPNRDQVVITGAAHLLAREINPSTEAD